MLPFYFKCGFAGLVVALFSLLTTSPTNALAVLVGTSIVIVNLWAYTGLVQLYFAKSDAGASKAKMLLLAFALFLKLLIVFASVAVAIYFFNPVFVALGLTTLLAGILWQTVESLYTQSKPQEQ